MLGLEHFHFLPTILQGISTVKQHAIVWQDGKGKRCFRRVHRVVKNIFALKPHLSRLMRQPKKTTGSTSGGWRSALGRQRACARAWTHVRGLKNQIVHEAVLFLRGVRS